MVAQSQNRQIILKKVRGDVSPADPLTKLLATKDKVDQLVDLYGCVFMSGRAKSAPMLKRKEGYRASAPAEYDLELDIIDDLDESREVVVPEADLHDITVWPHLHGKSL